VNALRANRPSVLGRIPLDRSAVIEASAGTGKTHTLEHLVVELLLATEVTLDRSLVVTFTEKATNELRARLRAKLEELASPNGASTPTPATTDNFWSIDDGARRKLERALHSFDAATVTTIHAFCHRVLRENAFASGRMFHEQQVDGRDAFGRAMRDALRRDVACDEVRAAWLEAALRMGWSIQRIEELLWDCVQSRGELRPALNQENLQAALEAFPIEDARRPDGASEMGRWGMHAATARTAVRRLYDLAEIVERAREARSVSSYVIEAQEAAFPYLLEKLPSSPPRSGAIARLCLAALELARATPTFPAGLAQTILPPVVEELERRKRESGQYDFDDMLGLVEQALCGPRAAALAAAMRERWQYVLIDEFQDTDETQWAIFRRAFFADTRASVLYLVGDPKQSIYRFRGADLDTFLRARDEVAEKGGEVVRLELNYRATDALVAAINAVFDQDSPKPIFTGALAYSAVQSGRPDCKLVDGRGQTVSPIHVMRFVGAPDFHALTAIGERIAREIRIATDPARPWLLGGRALDSSDVFVLTRNAREGRTVATALRAGNVPYAFYKQDGLFQTDEAKEVRTLLMAIDQPNDRARRLAAWLTPFFGLPLNDIDRAKDLPGVHPLVERLHAWKALAEARDFEGLFESIVVGSGVVRREIFFAEGERELTNYLHVFELLLEHIHRSHATLRDLVHALSGLIEGTRLPLDLEGNVQRLESDRRAVQIMSIHKSKGLEAALVFVVGGFQQQRSDSARVYHDEGRRLAWVGPTTDPDVERRAKAEEREEDQRLMYVALTRAKGRLYLPFVVDDRVGKQGQPRTLRGPYDAINRRIGELVQTGEANLSVEDVTVVGNAPAASLHSIPSQEESWRPPQALLHQQDDRTRFADLRARQAGAFVTSYTRMKGDIAALHPEFAVRSFAPLARDAEDSILETELRPARTSGVFLHEVLERVPLISFQLAGAFDEWRSRVDVSSVFDETMAVNRIDRAQREHAERLVWAAYTTPLTLSDGTRLKNIATAARVVREMGFVFPMEAGADAAIPVRSTPGFVRGSIDLAFEHERVTYFVDWKTDSLASYSREAITRHVRAHYETQAQLYAVAVCKLLGVRTRHEHETRFGGMLYCFLRGLDCDGHGLWFARPSWDSVREWEQAIRPPLRRPSRTRP
jgi:exodeoxyribonuclease V beta subunit